MDLLGYYMNRKASRCCGGSPAKAVEAEWGQTQHVKTGRQRKTSTTAFKRIPTAFKSFSKASTRQYLTPPTPLQSVRRPAHFLLSASENTLADRD